MLLDPDTLDLVQHIDTVLAATAGHELRAADQRRADAVGARDRDAGLQDGCRRRPELKKLRGYVCEIARDQGLRVGSAGTHPFSLFERQRITARDRYRQLVDQLQYVARRELIFGMHIHVAVDDPEKAIQVVNGLLAHLSQLLALSASLAVLARRADGPRVERQMVFAAFPRSGPPPRFRTTPTTPRCRAAREDGLHRRLHAHLVGHPPPPAARHDRDPDLRRRHARRGRRRDRSVLPVARQALLRAATRRASRSPPTTASSRARTSGSPPATGSRRR